MAHPRELKVNALSFEERSYLFGLFMTDGRADVTRVGNGYRGYRVRFFLQGNEGGIAEKVVEMLRRLGLNPQVYGFRPDGDYMLTVHVYSKALFDILPNMKVLLRDVTVRERFFAENRLFGVGSGVPFLGGLLDGDGGWHVRVRRGYGLRSISKECYFTQTRYPFLIDYVKSFVESLARSSAMVGMVSNGGRRVRFHKSGVEALLEAGIAKHSWKVEKWLERIAELDRERKKYCTLGEVAKMLSVSHVLVWSWVKTGKLRHLTRSLGTQGKKSKRARWYYVPVDEVDRFRNDVLKKKERVERTEGEW